MRIRPVILAVLLGCVPALANPVLPASTPTVVTQAPSTSGGAPAPADEDAPSPDPFTGPDGESTSMVGTLLRTLVVLGIVLGLVYVTLNYGLRRLMGVRALPAGRSTVVKVIERIPLDPKRSLFVIQAAGEYLLVGGGDDGLSLITRLDQAEVDRVLTQRTQASPAMTPFLQKLLSRKDQTP